MHTGTTVERRHFIASLLALPIGSTVLVLTVPGILVLDLANGLLGEGRVIPALLITPGELGRSALLFAGTLALLRFRGPYFRPLQRWVVLLLALGILGPLAALFTTTDVLVFLFDFEKLSKVLFGPLVIALFLAVYIKYQVSLETVFKVIAIWGTLAGLGVILFNVAGIGEATYGSVSSAFKGLFIAQNDLGLGMTISLAASSYLVMAKPKPRRFIPLLVTIAGMLILGTRTSTLGAVVVPVAVLLTHHDHRFYGKLRWRRIAVAAGVILALLVAGSQVAQRLATEGYQAEKYQKLMSGELTRVVLLAGAFQYTGNRSLASDLIGDGAFRYETGVADALPFRDGRALAEVDWMDLYGAHGVFFVIAVYAFYTWILVWGWKIDRVESKAAKWTLLLMGGLYLAHATLAGHAFASPIPTGLVAPVLAHGWWISRRESIALRRQRAVEAR